MPRYRKIFNDISNMVHAPFLEIHNLTHLFYFYTYITDLCQIQIRVIISYSSSKTL